MGEISFPNTDELRYRAIWGMCPKCHKMFKFAYRGKLPVWQQTPCPFCHILITPIGIEKAKLESLIENSDINPSKRVSIDRK